MSDRPHSAPPSGPRGAVSDAAVVAATRVAAGAAIMAVAGLSAMANRIADAERPDESERSLPLRIAAAMLASVIETERRTAGVLQAAQARMRPVVDAARSNPLFKPIEGLRASSDELAGRGVADAERGAEQMLDALDAALTYVVHEVLRRVDLNELLRSVDVNALVQQVDVQGLVDRVDPNTLVDRLDVDAVARRIDVQALARRVLDEIDVGNVIRESTGTLTVETVDAVRERGVDADQRLARFIDSVLRRANGRDTRVRAGQPDDKRSGPT